MSLISTASGLPTSTLYWHFSSKDELLAAVAERGARRWFRSAPVWSTFGGDLPAYLAAVGRAAGEHPYFLRILYMLTLDGRDGAPGARQTVGQVRRRALRELERVMADHFGANLGDQAGALAHTLATDC